jgi:hypothetical protein
MTPPGPVTTLPSSHADRRRTCGGGGRTPEGEVVTLLNPRICRHEVDHLFGVLYRARMRPGVEPFPVSQYKGAGQQWTYRWYRKLRE